MRREANKAEERKDASFGKHNNRNEWTEAADQPVKKRLRTWLRGAK